MHPYYKLSWVIWSPSVKHEYQILKEIYKKISLLPAGHLQNFVHFCVTEIWLVK